MLVTIIKNRVMISCVVNTKVEFVSIEDEDERNEDGKTIIEFLIFDFNNFTEDESVDVRENDDDTVAVDDDVDGINGEGVKISCSFDLGFDLKRNLSLNFPVSLFLCFDKCRCLDAPSFLLL